MDTLGTILITFGGIFTFLSALCISTSLDDENDDSKGCLFAPLFFGTAILFINDLIRGITLGIRDKKSKTRPFVILFFLGIALLIAGFILKKSAT
jgi:hypothetical protein